MFLIVLEVIINKHTYKSDIMRKQIKLYCVNDALATLTPNGILPILENDQYFAQSPIQLEKALIFLTILNLRALNLIKEQDEELWCPLHSELIKKILVSNSASEIIGKLKELEIIEVNDHYYNGLFTKKYKITDKFVLNESKARRLKEYNAIQKIFNIEAYFLNKYKNKIIKQILLNMRCIFIEKDAAIARTNEIFSNAINDLIKKESIKLSNSLKNKLSYDFSLALISELIIEIKKNTPIEISNRATEGLESIQNKMKSYLNKIHTIEFNYCLSASISESNGRLFNCFVNLPKELRPFLYIKDKKTKKEIYHKIEFDGKNTQPCLLCVKMVVENAKLDADFAKACFEGNIYDLIAFELQNKLFDEKGIILDKDEARKWVKTRFMDTLLFTSNNGEYATRLEEPEYKHKQMTIFIEYFRDRFPNVYYWLKKTKKQLAKDAKQKYKDEGDFEKAKERNLGGSELALIIQRMESDLWIQGLLKAVIEKYGEKFIYYTIHDSIVVFNPNGDIENFIRSKFIELSLEMFGVELPLKEKRTGESPLVACLAA